MFAQVSQGVYVRAEGTLQKQHALNQRSPARSGIENRWPKGKAKVNIDNQALYPILLLAFVFFTFSITDLLKGNGYLAVYIAGIMVGNNKIMHC